MESILGAAPLFVKVYNLFIALPANTFLNDGGSDPDPETPTAPRRTFP